MQEKAYAGPVFGVLQHKNGTYYFKFIIKLC